MWELVASEYLAPILKSYICHWVRTVTSSKDLHYSILTTIGTEVEREEISKFQPHFLNWLMAGRASAIWSLTPMDRKMPDGDQGHHLRGAVTPQGKRKKKKRKKEKKRRKKKGRKKGTMNNVKLLYVKCCFFEFVNSPVALKQKKIWPQEKVEMMPLVVTGLLVIELTLVNWFQRLVVHPKRPTLDKCGRRLIFQNKSWRWWWQILEQNYSETQGTNPWSA